MKKKALCDGFLNHKWLGMMEGLAYTNEAH
jgi:hypothetical protein